MKKTVNGHIYTVPDGLMEKVFTIVQTGQRKQDLNLDPTKGWDYDDYFDAVAKLTNKDEKHYGGILSWSTWCFRSAPCLSAVIHRWKTHMIRKAIFRSTQTNVWKHSKNGQMYI